MGAADLAAKPVQEVSLPVGSVVRGPSIKAQRDARLCSMETERSHAEYHGAKPNHVLAQQRNLAWSRTTKEQSRQWHCCAGCIVGCMEWFGRGARRGQKLFELAGLDVDR